MQNYPNQSKIPYAPTETELYPEADGKPMAVSDMHRRILTRILQTLEHHFIQRPEVYVSGDILVYYREGHPQKVVSPRCSRHFRHRSETSADVQSLGGGQGA